MTNVPRTRRDRGARERILRTAGDLFYRQGINTTGVSELRTAANVSIRTLYSHFPSKDDIVLAYLDRIAVTSLDRTDLSPRERLLGIFTGGIFAVGIAGEPDAGPGTPRRGCPLINAGIEFADPDHPVHRYVAKRKTAFAERLTAIAREAGAADPETLGQQLALLYDGSAARAMALNSSAPRDVALAMATQLVDAALQPGTPDT